jgi:hypothetical protein
MRHNKHENKKQNNDENFFEINFKRNLISKISKKTIF